jgi:hypothetical protein
LTSLFLLNHKFNVFFSNYFGNDDNVIFHYVIRDIYYCSSGSRGGGGCTCGSTTGTAGYIPIVCF